MRRRYAKKYHSPGKSHLTRQRHVLGDAVKRHPLYMFFLASFFLGVWCMNLWRGQQTSLVIALQQFFQWDGSGMGTPSADLFVFLLKERGMLLLVILFFGAGKYGRIFHGLFVTYAGFAGGMIFASFLLVFGAMGAILFACSFFPQILFYLPVYFFLLKASGGWARLKERKAGGFSGREKAILSCVFTLVLLLALFGVLAEAYLNPLILGKVSEIVLK